MKIRISLLILLIIGTVACHRKVCNFMAFRPTSSQASTIPMNSTDSISGLEHTDSMYLNVFFQGEIVETCADLSMPSFSLGGEAMALAIMPNIFEKPLKSFEITSNQVFNDIPAGQSLKSKLWGIPSMSPKMEAEAYLQIFKDNTGAMNSGNGFVFQFKERPQILTQQFNIALSFKDGRRFEMNGINGVWK